jgi:hypothetical protein
VEDITFPVFTWDDTAPLFEDWMHHSIRQLKAIASARKIRRYNTMTKAQLIAVLEVG